MAMYLRGRPEPTRVSTWLGKTIVYPERPGLVAGLIEIWHLRAYQPNGFYLPNPDDVVIDIGANVGLFSIDILRGNRKARVFAIEPCKENFEALVANLETFGGDEATAMQLACGRASSYATIIRGNRSLDDGVKFTSDQSEGSVESISLPELLERISVNQVAYLKIDVEGSEIELFQDCDDPTLARIDRMAMEYHDNIRDGCLDTAVNRLQKTHAIKIVPSSVTGCGLLFASRR